jgi:ATP-binding cassette subfamily B protein
MPQTVHLFSDSIRANLGFGIQPDPSDEALIAVCKRAQVWSDIQALPNGLDTEIGERGVRLSGGQRQRLALARLLLHEAEVYLLDDVVSAVDTRTESAILEELFKLPNPFLVVSHRPVTLSRCDRIIYLREGIIEYDGPYSKMDARLIANLGDDSAVSDEVKTV